MTKKLLSLLFAVSILYGCQTVDAVITDAQKLQTDVVAKVAEVRNGIDNVVTDAKDAYEALLEKKRQLEEMVAQINAAVDSVNKLLGKENSAETTQDLQVTIDELRNALNQAEATLGEVDAAEAQLAEPENPVETPAVEETPTIEEVPATNDSPETE
jgi:predicted  nucleic acid-binding Zn-ribbon protein